MGFWVSGNVLFDLCDAMCMCFFFDNLGRTLKIGELCCLWLSMKVHMEQMKLRLREIK